MPARMKTALLICPLLAACTAALAVLFTVLNLSSGDPYPFTLFAALICGYGAGSVVFDLSSDVLESLRDRRESARSED